jgi:type II secretory ATPase GspE/PulE/Tfp pilus assembly ATPase PilB-like protein
MVEASLTGHLVFSTLHTNSAPETVIRLLGLGIEPAHFIDSFRGIMAQRLVRTLCDKCKRKYRPDGAEIRQIQAYYGKDYLDDLKADWDSLELYQAVGCEHCHGSGYRGRMAIHELLTASPELNDAIYRGETGAAELFRIGMKTGMRTLIQDGIAKLLEGHIDIVQLRKVVVT